MFDETHAVEAGNAIGVSASNVKDGIVFVRLLTQGCWAFTADHRVYYIHRNQSRRVHPRGIRIFDCHDPWSPDKGIA
jgi:hypothetical protein